MVTSEKNMKVYEEEFKQRAFDGKWQRWIKIPDPDNAYTYRTETGSSYTLVPETWVVSDVYDYLLTIED